MPPHLFLILSVGDTVGIRWYHEGRDALRAAVGVSGARHQNQNIGCASAGNEHFAAIDHIAVAISNRTGAETGRVGAGTGFGQAVRSQPFTTGQPGDNFLAKIIRGETCHHPGGHVVDGDEGGGGRARCRQLFHNHRGIQARQAHTTQGFGRVHAHKTHGSGFFHDIDRKNMLGVPLGGMGRHGFFSEGSGSIPKRLLVFSEIKIHRQAPWLLRSGLPLKKRKKGPVGEPAQ